MRSHPGAWFVALLVLLALVVFWNPIFSGQSLYASDGMPYTTVIQKAGLPSSLMGGWGAAMLGGRGGPYPFVPVRLLLLVLPPLVCHALFYVLDSALLAIAFCYFLRGRGVRWPAASLGALAMGFSAHSFTLITAGHLGKFDMMPMAVFMLAFLDRAVIRRSLFHYALAGAAAGFGFTSQPDVMVLFGLLAAAYGVFLALRTLPGRGERGRALLTSGLGVALAAGFFLAVASVGMRSFFTQTVESRREIVGDNPENKWIFATNWSLPPEEMLEFVAPCVFGIETGDQRAPYWGRLGRTPGWSQHKQGLMNLRQHTVYLGVLQLAFGLLALARAARRRGDGAAGGAEEDAGRRAEIFFWAAVFAVALSLALGRYFVTYRLFFSLPYCSGMRAPVKFMHVMEVALAFLFACGVDAYLADLSLRRGAANASVRGPYGRLAVLWGVAGLGLLLAAALAGVFRPGLEKYWSELGVAAYSDRLAATMRGALRRGAALSGLAALLLGWPRWGARRWAAPAAAVVAVIALALFSDTASVARRYVKVLDLGPMFERNALIRTLQADGTPSRLSCPFDDPPFGQWKFFMLRRHVVDVLEPINVSRPPEDYVSFLRAFGNNIVRLWQVSGTRYVVGPKAALRGLAARREFQTALEFDADGRGGIVEAAPGGGAYVLLRFTASLPRAAVYYGWEALGPTQTLARLSAADWQPGRAALVPPEAGTRDSASPAEPVSSLVHAPQRVRIEVDAKEEALVLLNDRWDPDWRATVDGRPEPILRCNYIMRGVRVPAGHHRIEFSYHPYRAELLVALGALAVLAAWAAWRVRPRRAGEKL